MFLKRFMLVVVLLLGVYPRASEAALFHAWSQRFGSTAGDIGYAVAVDASSNVIMTGEFTGSVDFGGVVLTSSGGADIFVAKYDVAGNLVWCQGFGDALDQFAYGVAVDASGDIVVTGDFYGTVDFGGTVLTSAGVTDICVAKFRADGSHVWSQGFGDVSADEAEDVAIDASGGIVVTGNFYGTVDFGGGLLTSPGGRDIFIAKFDAAGSHVWSRNFGDASSQYGYGVAVDASDNVVVTGYFSGTVDFGGGLLTSAGGSDICVAKFDAAGTHIWSQGFGDAVVQYGYGVAVDASGNIIVTGNFYGTVDFGGGVLTSAGNSDIYVAKFDATGSHIWSKHFGDFYADEADDVAIDASGNIIVTGNFYGTVDFGGGLLTSAGTRDIFIARFDAAGSHDWSRNFGDTSNQYAHGVASDAWGNVSVTGEFNGTVDFGGGALTSAGGADIFLARFWRALPTISDVWDLPGDEGGVVVVAWGSSGVDAPVYRLIDEYTVWRGIDIPAALEALESGAQLAYKSIPTGSSDGCRILRADSLAGSLIYWELMETVPAYYMAGYFKPIATLYDSTSTNPALQYFQVIAHSNVQDKFYVSEPYTGYSVDNLAPLAPQALSGSQSVAPDGLELAWAPNTEADLWHYAVYRGMSSDFTPGPGNLVAETTDTTTFDSGWTWSTSFYYKVSAVDIHENESPHALLEPENITNVGESIVPRATYLSQNFPNPFNPATTISYGLAAPTDVSLKIYDASGKLVRVLYEGRREARHYQVEWDGRNTNGVPVASGVYFCRLTAGLFVETRKMVSLK